jgi:hypothetical protein
MELEENVRLINVKSHLWSMVRAAGEGVYKDEFKTDEGAKRLHEAYEEELLIVANQAFNKGREYESNKK